MLDGRVMSYELTSNLGGRLSGGIEDWSLLEKRRLVKLRGVGR